MSKLFLPIVCIALLASCKSGHQSQKNNMVFAPANTKSVKLPVKVLPTEDGAEESGEVNKFKYPAEMSLYGLDNIGDVAAYGASYQLWLGPKDWTGRGMVGADGNVRVELYPVGGSLEGAHITYYQVPACQGCILNAAGLYFPAARAEYNEVFNQDNSSPLDTTGYEIKPMSETLVSYTRPVKNGLVTRGIAYYTNTGDKYFAEATFVMPADKAGLIDLLQKQFISSLPK